MINFFSVQLSRFYKYLATNSSLYDEDDGLSVRGLYVNLWLSEIVPLLNIKYL
jgi:hypothetical protein